jgi:hypothetical protein
LHTPIWNNGPRTRVSAGCGESIGAEEDTVSQSDPTDSALAAIASIFDGSAEQRTANHAGEHRYESVDVDGYSKSGPGPLDSIRFKWTARRDEAGRYFVDETVGTGARPISIGPMPRDEVIRFIDERERTARQRYEALRSEMNESPAPRQAPSHES